MNAFGRSILFGFALLAVSSAALATGLEPGQAGGEFTLEKPGGGTVTLESLLGGTDVRAVVVIVASYECPFSKRAHKELIPIVKELESRGVRFVSIFPNEGETPEGIREYSEQDGPTHLLLKDPGGAVARQYGAGVTPTFFLFDKTGVLRYRGNRKKVSEAVESVLAGEVVAVAKSDPVGCTVKWPAPAARPAPEAEPPAEGAPPELTEEARAWLDRLIPALSSEDDIVRRSAFAAIQAFGTPALPRLKLAREEAKGVLAEELDRAIQLISRPPRRFAGPGGGGRRSMLALQRRLLGEVGLTEEQERELDRLFPIWEEKEREVIRLREEGDRSGAREAYLDLQEEARKKIDEILTPEQRQKLEDLRGGMRSTRPRDDGGDGDRR